MVALAIIAVSFFYSFPENVFGGVIGRRYTKKYNLLPLALPKSFSEKLYL